MQRIAAQRKTANNARPSQPLRPRIRRSISLAIERDLVQTMTKAIVDPIMQSPAFQPLDARSRDIFRMHRRHPTCSDGEPVGSRSLSRILPSIALTGHDPQRDERPGAVWA
jgi:hypothetical protein